MVFTSNLGADALLEHGTSDAAKAAVMAAVHRHMR
jgi:hypothetical protein